MNCTKCGALIPEGQKFCQSCGQPVFENSDSAQQVKNIEENSTSQTEVQISMPSQLEIKNEDLNYINNSNEIQEQNVMSGNKVVYIFVIIGVLLILGISAYFIFSSKKLQCTIAQTDADLKMNTTIEMKFHATNLSTFRLTNDVTLSGESLKNKTDIIDNYKGEFDKKGKEYEDAGIKYTFTETTNGFIVEYTGNKKNMSVYQKLVDNNTSYDSLKKSFENDGYTCK